MINHSYDNPRLEFPYLQSYPVTEEFSSVTCFVANFRHFVKNILKKNKFLSWLPWFWNSFCEKKTGSFILYRRGDIVQSLTNIWTYLQMCTSTWKIAQNCEQKLSKATFATGCATQMNLYRSRFCKQPRLCAGSSTRFGKQKLERTAGKIWYSNSVRPCTQNVHWDTA